MGYKLTLFPNAESLKPDVKCTACGCVLDNPVCLPCDGRHLVCLTCLRSQRGADSGCQRLFRCPACEERIDADFALRASASGAGVPNWIRVELSSLRLACPKRCGLTGLRIGDLTRHYATECGKAEVTCPNSGCGASCKREKEAAHNQECSFRRVECRVCKKKMLNKDLLAHQVKTRCHEMEVKLAKKQCMKQCNKDVLSHYRQLRENSLVSMQEMRRAELSHLERMGVQGFVRRDPVPLLSSLSLGDGVKRCDRCCRMFSDETNHEMACKWHGGPIIQTFGGLCLACGKPSHTEGCIISAHHLEAASVSPNKTQSSKDARVKI